MISKGKIKYTSIRGFEYRVYRFKRVESVTRSVTSRCHADWFRFECAKSWSPSRGEIFLSLHERAERETKILTNWIRAKTRVYSMLGLEDQIEIDHFDEIMIQI